MTSFAIQQAGEAGSVLRTAQRRELLGDVFRVAAGLMLAAYFVEQAVTAPVLIGAQGLWPAQIGTVSDAAAWARGLPAWLLRAAFIACAALSVFVARGIAAAASGFVLYALSAVAYQALYPVVTLDDHVARLLALLLALGAGSHARGTLHPRFVLGAWLFVVYLQAGVLEPLARHDHVAILSASGLSACLVLRRRAAALVGLIPALGSAYSLHRIHGSVLFVAMLLAAYLHWIARRAFAEPRALAHGPALDLSAALALALALVSVFGMVAQAGGLSSVEAATQRLSASAGLFPQDWTAPITAAPELELRVDSEATCAPHTRLGPGGVRLQNALRLLASVPNTETALELQRGSARRFVRAFCENGPTGPGRLSIAALRSAGAPQALAWFDCHGDRPPEIVWLGAYAESNSARESGPATSHVAGDARPALVPVEPHRPSTEKSK
ncbi:MAG TPA: hypothetical protein VJV78_31685 [Polyangiales bacterium]|nr:hypothetical protein [Polyangiales bacterium]